MNRSATASPAKTITGHPEKNGSYCSRLVYAGSLTPWTRRDSRERANASEGESGESTTERREGSGLAGASTLRGPAEATVKTAFVLRGVESVISLCSLDEVPANLHLLALRALVVVLVEDLLRDVRPIAHDLLRRTVPQVVGDRSTTNPVRTP